MANPWFRLWADMVNDPKFRTIARVSKQEISRVISVYVHMMTCASNATERGRTEGWCDEDVATALDIETSDVQVIREAMQGRVLDGDYLTGWEKRQPLKEDDSAARAKAWREAQKAAKAQEQTTPNDTERPRTQEEIRVDTDKKEVKASAAPKSPKPSKKNKTPLPADFAVSERVEKWAKEKGYGKLEAHLENFLCSCRKNGYCYVDWDEGFMDAIRKDWAKLRTVGYQPGAPPAAAPKPILPVEKQVPALAPMQRSGRPANFDSIKQELKARETA